MRVAKLVIGIVSMVLFIFITFQSCATGFSNVLEGNELDTSGVAGFLLALFMLIAGIIGVSSRKSKGGGITAGVFYVVASLIGFINLGNFIDLVYWSILSLGFGLFFIIGSALMKKPVETTTETQN